MSRGRSRRLPGGIALAGLSPKNALTAIEEATETYRELARARPDAFRPDLATSLHNLSADLAGLGRPADALTAIDPPAPGRASTQTQNRRG